MLTDSVGPPFQLPNLHVSPAHSFFFWLQSLTSVRALEAAGAWDARECFFPEEWLFSLGLRGFLLMVGSTSGILKLKHRSLRQNILESSLPAAESSIWTPSTLTSLLERIEAGGPALEGLTNLVCMFKLIINTAPIRATTLGRTGTLFAGIFLNDAVARFSSLN